MKRFKNLKILIAPYSPLTKKLTNYLKKQFNIKLIGYIDANQKGSDIYKVNTLHSIDFDFILIFSPNHFKAIYNTLKKYISNKKIYKIDLFQNQYKAYNFFEIFIQNIQYTIINFHKKVQKRFLKTFSLFIDQLNIKRKISVFIAEDYVDANIKHLFLYYYTHNQKAILVTNNIQQKKEFEKYNLKTAILYSWTGYFYTAIAKNIYLDHFILDYLEYTSPKQITIQLWHGVGLKPIRDRSKYRYNYFISTSNWTNETNFENVFKADNFLNFGYPRNDILLKQKESLLDLILCDMHIYNNLRKNKENNVITILYMPTFRENGFESFPLDFKILNQSMQEKNIMFYVKLHPFVLDKYRESIKAENYSNIIFYNTQGDIYPILKYIDILITDYSSIAYDFLFLNRPIIFFNYDYQEYIDVRENTMNNKFLFSYYDYTPGIKVQTQKELITTIYNLIYPKKDLYKIKKIEMKYKFFSYCDQNSSERITNLIQNQQLI